MQKGLLILFLFLTTLLKAQDIDVLSYKFIINLTDKNDSIQGLAQITFVQKSDKPQLSLDLTAVNKTGKGMKVLAVRSEAKSSTELSFSQTAQKLLINTPLLKKGDTTTVVIAYQGIPDDGLIISKNKYGDRTFFADNWPNRAHHWIPCNDRPDDKAVFAFSVTAPSHYSVISNGIKKAEKLLADGNKTTIWTEDIALPTKVMVIGVARFATRTFADSPKDIPVSAWVYPQDSTKGFYDYALATGIVKFFSGYIAPFPYNKLANVQSKTIFGGMENASCIFYAEDLITGNRTMEETIAHEIAHQWFGDMASEKSFAHLWLSEGFATYFTNLYWEHKYGKEAMLERMKKDREEIIAFSKSSSHAVVDSTTDLMSLLNINSYQKGGWVLHMLRAEVGDSAFHKIIKTYYNQYKGGNAETRDFEAVAEKVSGKDLKWFFDEWLYQESIPNLEVIWIPETKSILVRQLQKKMFQFPLDVSYTTENGKHITITLQVNKTVQEFKAEGNPVPGSLRLDLQTKLLFTGSAITGFWKKK